LCRASSGGRIHLGQKIVEARNIGYRLVGRGVGQAAEGRCLRAGQRPQRAIARNVVQIAALLV